MNVLEFAISSCLCIRCRPKLDIGYMTDEGRRLSKPHPTDREREQRERAGKEKAERERHSWPPLPPPPPSVSGPEGGGVVEGKDTRARPERGGRVEEREGRRKREDEWSEPRELGRKRKREFSEGDCTPPPETKRVRSANYADARQQSAEAGREEKHTRPIKEADIPERKRRHEGSSSGVKEQPNPKKTRSSAASEGQGGGGSSRKPSRAELSPSSATVSSSSSRKRQHKERAEQEHGESEGEGKEGAKPKKLDWSSISALSLPKPKPATSLAVQRFSPGAIFARTGVSRSLAGPSIYREVCLAISKHLAGELEAISSETGNRLSESLLESPFGDSEFAMTGASRIRNEKENCRVCVNIGPCRKALTASADFSLRRKLRKASKVCGEMSVYIQL